MARLDGLKLHARQKWQSGQLDVARSAYLGICRDFPGDVESWVSLAAIEGQLGDLDASERDVRRALEIDPDCAIAWLGLGNVQSARGRRKEAVTSFRKAVALHPTLATAYSNLGNALIGLGEAGEAVRAHSRACELMPGNARAQYNRGVALREHGDLEGAMSAYRLAISADPGLVAVYNNAGHVARSLGNYDEALDLLGNGLRLDPDNAQILFERSLVELVQGNFVQGFRDYEARLQTPEFADLRQVINKVGKPVWDGSAMSGKTLLVLSEQGFGDAIQFSRFVPVLKAHTDARVHLYCRSSLRGLFESLEGVDEVIADDVAPENLLCDACVPLMSLPHRLGVTAVDNTPNNAYLGVSGSANWQDVQSAGNFRIGLVWAGSPTHRNDAARSLSLQDLAPLFKVSGCRFFSLQKGPGEADVDSWPEITSLSGRIETFSDTAEAIQALDLLIAVDTSVAHLAGALGKSVWVLLPSVPDWRWMLEREDSPWYPSMTLIRQTRKGDWAGVIEKAVARLEEIV